MARIEKIGEQQKQTVSTICKYVGLEGLERSPACESAEIIKNGGVVIIPTETLYGFSADARVSDFSRRINEIKRRKNIDQELVVLLRWEWLEKYVDNYQRFLPLLEKFSPGPLTIVAPAMKNVLPSPPLSKDNKIAFRISSSWYIEIVLDELGFPIVTSSTNVEGEEPILNPDKIIEKFFGVVEGIYVFPENSEYQKHLYGKPSTIIEATESHEKFRIKREGYITKEELISAGISIE